MQDKSPADLLPAGPYVKEEEILFFTTQKGETCPPTFPTLISINTYEKIELMFFVELFQRYCMIVGKWVRSPNNKKAIFEGTYNEKV